MFTETAEVHCPYCGEKIELVIDASIPQQSYIEDCFVCCRPITVSVMCSEQHELLSVQVAHENE